MGRGAEPFEVKAGTFVGSERLLDLVGKQVGVDGGRELSLVLDFDAASRDIDAVTRCTSPERSLTARLSGSPGPRVPLRCRPSGCSNGTEPTPGNRAGRSWRACCSRPADRRTARVGPSPPWRRGDGTRPPAEPRRALLIGAGAHRSYGGRFSSRPWLRGFYRSLVVGRARSRVARSGSSYGSVGGCRRTPHMAW